MPFKSNQIARDDSLGCSFKVAIVGAGTCERLDVVSELRPATKTVRTRDHELRPAQVADRPAWVAYSCLCGSRTTSFRGRNHVALDKVGDPRNPTAHSHRHGMLDLQARRLHQPVDPTLGPIVDCVRVSTLRFAGF